MRPSRFHTACAPRARHAGRRLLLCAALACASLAARADDRTDQLKRCLADFGGIEWQLPYLPTMHITSCAAPATGDAQPGARRTLELIEDLVLPPVPHPPDEDLDYVAVQEAVFQHFDALFKRHGFTRTGVEYGDARTHTYARTTSMRRAGDISGPVDPAQARQEAQWVEQRNARERALPPIPFTRSAHYARTDSTGAVTLVLESSARNTWRITVDGLPAAGNKEAR
jgi:hypothetical protein